MISHLVSGAVMIALAISENGKEGEPEGPVWLAGLAFVMVLICDVVCAVIAVAGAAIMLAFKKSFGRSFVHIFSVVLILLSVLVLIGILVPEEWTEDPSALPKMPVEVE